MIKNEKHIVSEISRRIWNKMPHWKYENGRDILRPAVIGLSGGADSTLVA